MVNLRSFSSTYKIFPELGWSFPVNIFEEESSNENISSLAGLKKRFSFSRRSTDFGDFWLPRSNFKNDLLKVEAKFQKIRGQFPGGGCLEQFAKF